MAITFAAEMLLMMYVLMKKGVNSIPHRIIVLLLLFLALFQLSEYGVCESLGLDPTIWARVGFVSITMLPPLGIHLVQKVRKDSNLTLAYGSYLLSLVFVVAFVFFDSFQSVGCSGNYAIFQISDGLGGAYFAYYYALLMLAVALAIDGWRKGRDSQNSQTLLYIVAGYASFVAPATFIHFVFDGVSNGLPSIMCGFALIFAVALATVISDRIPTSED